MTAVTAVATKRCNMCGKRKPLDAFGLRRKSPDGLQGHCKACNRVQIRERRANDPAFLARGTKQAKAYWEALSRLREAHRDEFDQLYAEELTMRGVS